MKPYVILAYRDPNHRRTEIIGPFLNKEDAEGYGATHIGTSAAWEAKKLITPNIARAKASAVKRS